MRHLLNAAFCLLLCVSPLSGASFDYSEPAPAVYRLALSLKIEEAERLLLRMQNRNPDNLAVQHLYNYVDFARLFTSEDPAAYARLKKNEEARIRNIQTGNPGSPYYLYVQADIRLQWALLKFRFNEPVSAFLDMGKAYRLLRRNQELFPSFLPNQKNLAILHALAGTIPDTYRWGARVLGGLSGTVNQGRAEFEQVLHKARKQAFFFKEETVLIYAYVLLRLCNEGEKAWDLLSDLPLNPQNNLLHCFVQADIAMQTGRNDAALETLEKRPAGPGFLPFPQLDYMLGAARLRKLDPRASNAFLTFLAQHKGPNGIKDTYQKLAWHAWALRNDQAAYRQYMLRAIKEGQAVAGADKNALEEAETQQMPLKALLKARLLFDGGYYQEALQAVQAAEPHTFAQRLEYHYRSGRILHALKNYPKALANYQKTIALGRNDASYLACNAALQSGLIYELLGKTPEAERFFQICLSMNPEDYRSGLHQAAKAGLSRLKDQKN